MKRLEGGGLSYNVVGRAYIIIPSSTPEEEGTVGLLFQRPNQHIELGTFIGDGSIYNILSHTLRRVVALDHTSSIIHHDSSRPLSRMSLVVHFVGIPKIGNKGFRVPHALCSLTVADDRPYHLA